MKMRTHQARKLVVPYPIMWAAPSAGTMPEAGAIQADAT